MTSNDSFENSAQQIDPLHCESETERTEFFDRERWHDVESEIDVKQEENVSKNNTVYTLFSIGILFLVIIIAGVCGLFTAYYVSTLTPSPPVANLDYRTVPSQWIGYVEDSVFFCDVNEPLCFAGDGNETLYIGDGNPPSVYQFSLKEKWTRTIPLKSKPTALAVGTSGQLFAGQLLVAHTDQLTVYTMDGKPEWSVPFPDEKSAVYSIALTDHAVYAADTGKRLIHQFNGQGQLLRSFGQLPEKTSESAETFPGFAVYLSPITLTVNRKTGLLHITNPGKHRIETFTPEGYWEPSLSWGEASSDLSGFAGCCNPVSIATLEDGKVVTAEKFITRVKVFFTNKRLDCVVAGPEVLDKPPQNIPPLASFHLPASDTGRSVFVTVLENDHIAVFDPVMRVLRYFIPL